MSETSDRSNRSRPHQTRRGDGLSRPDSDIVCGTPHNAPGEHQLSELLRGERNALERRINEAEGHVGDAEITTSQLQPDIMLGPYRIVRHLASGGMAEVYLAHEEKIERFVAVKVVAVPIEHPGERAHARVNRFKRERKIQGLLGDHGNIVVAHHAGDCMVGTTAYHFLAMEYLAGDSLRVRLKTGGCLPVDEASLYVRLTAEGLVHAHRRNVVHRDIKPPNLLLSGGTAGTLKISDWGLARSIDEPPHEAQTVITEAGEIPGTVGYIAPERLRCPTVVDHRSDLYSLGCTFYELLAGGPPALGCTLGDNLQNLRAKRPDVSEELIGIIAKLLSEDADARYQSASDLIDDLSPGGGLAASPQRVPPQQSPDRGDAGDQQRRSRPLRRSLAAVAAIPMAAAFIFLIAWSPDRGVTGTDRAQFVTETVADGTELSPGEYFEKSWTLRNSGTSAWKSYEWMFIGGEQMRAPDAVPIEDDVAPGETCTVRVPMRAPMEPGEYQGEWQMRNSAGAVFKDRCYLLIRVRSDDIAAFVEDVTVSDDTAFRPGERFEKIWRLRNTGRTTWDRGYSLRFDGGDQLADISAIPVTDAVEPDATYEFKVDMEAPAKPGSYRGYWRLSSPLRRPFGDRIYVQIRVEEASRSNQ